MPYEAPANLNRGELKLDGLEGNSFVIIALVRKALRKAENPEAVIKIIEQEMLNGDRNYLLEVAMAVTYDPDQPEYSPEEI